MEPYAAPPCGWHCNGCSHFGRDCPGCRQTGGRPFWTTASEIEVCPVYGCCVELEVLDHCGLCPRLPCQTFLHWRDPSMSDEQFQQSLLERVAALRDRAQKEQPTVTTICRASQIALEIHTQLQASAVQNTPNVRRVRRRFSRALRKEDGPLVLDVARVLRSEYGYRAVAYEVILAHRGAFMLLGAQELEELGQGLDSWWSVDSFARTLSGPAWLKGLINYDVILKWARSPDKWWRRAALVSTVALNVKSHGGSGDVPRTLAICRLLVDDHDDMVEKALSWALRELVVHDAAAVRGVLIEHEARLGSRVKREVRNKLTTGLKSPRRRPHQ